MTGKKLDFLEDEDVDAKGNMGMYSVVLDCIIFNTTLSAVAVLADAVIREVETTLKLAVIQDELNKMKVGWSSRNRVHDHGHELTSLSLVPGAGSHVVPRRSQKGPVSREIEWRCKVMSCVVCPSSVDPDISTVRCSY